MKGSGFDNLLGWVGVFGLHGWCIAWDFWYDDTQGK